MKMKKLNQDQCIEQGRRLKKCLEMRNMKQNAFADKCGFTDQHISNMINGKGIAAHNIDKFAEILEVSRDYLSLKSNYMTPWDEIKSEVDRHQKIDNACISFLETMGYKFQDEPDAPQTYQVAFKADETDQEILQKVMAVKNKAKERPDTMFRVITPSCKKKLLSRHDVLRILAEVQAFSRSYMELRIGK